MNKGLRIQWGFGLSTFELTGTHLYTCIPSRRRSRIRVGWTDQLRNQPWNKELRLFCVFQKSNGPGRYSIKYPLPCHHPIAYGVMVLGLGVVSVLRILHDCSDRLHLRCQPSNQSRIWFKILYFQPILHWVWALPLASHFKISFGMEILDLHLTWITKVNYTARRKVRPAAANKTGSHIEQDLRV